MRFRIYDTATAQVRDFVPLVPGEVSIYHCGLTVQASPHVGHLRKEVVFDLLRRWLTHLGFAVTIVANITDIDDKILAKSADAGVPWWALANNFERELHAAYASLDCLPPSYAPRATGHIPEMLELTQTLINSGHAYPAADDSGDVYFDVHSFPQYGELSRQRLEDMAPAADADPRGKRDPRDFALWKGHKESEPRTASWPAPWGRGRPGWHLECSAMAGKYLGDAFDIHGGGIDLRFPHHENERAQSLAAGRPFASYWMHNAWVTAGGEKMSKSLGNGALVSEATAAYPPRAVRLYLAGPHYRSEIEYSPESLREATAALERIDSFVERAAASNVATPAAAELPEAFVAALNDDLGTPLALAEIFASVRRGNAALARDDQPAVATAWAETQAMLEIFGLRADDPCWSSTGQSELLNPLMELIIEQRAAARERKDYAASDRIRDRLAELGIVLADSAAGTRWSS